MTFASAATVECLTIRAVLLATAAGDLRGPLDPHFLAGWATLALAFLTRNIIATVIAGVALFALLKWALV